MIRTHTFPALAAMLLMCSAAIFPPACAAEGAPPAAVQYQQVVTYRCEKEPYELAVPRLSRCGHCYYVYITAYRTKSVPVVTMVKVCP